MVEVQERFGKMYIVGSGETEDEAREHLEDIKAAMLDNQPLLGAPVRPLGTTMEPRRIETIDFDTMRVRLEGEDFTRAWSELEYYV